MNKQPDNYADAEAIFRKIVKEAKQATKYIAWTDLSPLNTGKFVITIETNIPEGVGDIAEAIIKKSKRGIHLQTKCHAGSFDWASDTYIKDCVLISFKF